MLSLFVVLVFDTDQTITSEFFYIIYYLNAAPTLYFLTEETFEPYGEFVGQTRTQV